jgi:hexosaminidase
MAAYYGPAAPGGGEAALLRCVEDAALPAEGYRLTVSPAAIEVAASSGAGAFHGLQTARQLLLSGAEGFPLRPGQGAAARFRVPCVRIEDAPAFSWRGFMLDCSRHFYTVAFIEKILDVMALHHLNIFHWHLTDDQGWRLPVPEYPLLTEIGAKRLNPFKQKEVYTEGFYSEDDIRRIVAFAAARHITVVPEVDLPGHTSAALAAYPDLGCTGGPYQVEYRHGVFKDILCAGNDALFTFTGAIFDTLARLFPGPYVHIGGDEAPTERWEACPRCRARQEALGLGESRLLQRWLTRRFVEMLRERGKTAIGWDEVMEASEGGGGDCTALPSGLIVMFWRSHADYHGKEQLLEAASRQGRRIIMTPNGHGAYLDYRQRDDPGEPGAWRVSTLEQSYYLRLAVPGVAEELVLGGQGNLWAESIASDPVAEYLAFPRLCALSEALWSKERDYADFRTRLASHSLRLDALNVTHCRVF